MLLSVYLKAAPAQRSDTLDIRKTIVHFSITDFLTKNISGHTRLLVTAKMNNIPLISLDLEGLAVDSVTVANNLVAFNYASPDLYIPLTQQLNLNDSVWVDVFYHGIPVSDPTWGGFSFVGNYAFQIGVGFTAQPHSFGRTWHPCFDNMVERSEYEFYITTTADKMAVCNGLFLDSVNLANGNKTWHWKLNETIPSYLAGVAVCNYTLVKKNLTGTQGNIDAWIACEPIDTNKVNGSFAHLQEAFSMMENRFGAHVFPRVGYSLVPFNGGAMEHATNIAIGRVFIDGSLDYETLIAHELSHHWFGDAVTCSHVGDMWLNEGFASYCENLFLEYTYGHEAYQEESRVKHFEAISSAHYRDAGYKSIANMDSLHTYGTTVYTKGADALHTLRTYMGDSLFFNGLKSYVTNHAFQSANTTDLRDYLTSVTGKNLQPFFQNWILSPGFTHFSIDSTRSVFNGTTFDVDVFLRQRKHQSTDYYSNVPLELAFYNAQGQEHIFHLEFTGRCMHFKVQLPFDPKLIWIDPNEKISDATTENHLVVKNTGTFNLPYAKCRLTVKNIVSSSDSSLLYVAHHWAQPDRFKNQLNANGYILHDKRYWRVEGINVENTQGTIRFDYNGLAANNYLDSNWVKNSEDSIRLFYRKDATQEWSFANDSLMVGSLNDKTGFVFSKEIVAGEYCLGIKRSGVTDPLITDAPSGGCSLVLHQSNEDGFKVPELLLYPNPAHQYIVLQGPQEGRVYEVRNVFGLLYQSGQTKKFETELNIARLPTGVYYIQLENQVMPFVKQ
jgi:hypothetical protein